MTQTQPTKQLQVKLVLLGDAAVGKSSLVMRFVHGKFDATREPTIGAAFLTQKIRIPERPNVLIKFEIWDTAGQERFSSLAPMYYRNAMAAIVAYDITKSATFDKAKVWINELKNNATPNVIIALAGNKSDLEVDRKVSKEDALKYATDNGLLFYETSARSDNNVTEMFTDIARNLPAELSQYKTTSSTTNLPELGEGSSKSGGVFSLLTPSNMKHPNNEASNGCC